MGFLSEAGVTALWNKIKANFGRKLTVSNTTITLQNGASTPTNLSQVTIPDATTSTPGAMSAADKTKLEGIETGANKYTHPTSAGNKHVPSGGGKGNFLVWSATGTAKWDSDTTATSSANGLMSSADKSKLDGIEANANNYAHPTSSGNKHVPSGGSAGKFLVWNSDGTAKWDSATTATASANGLMSATDKGKLDALESTIDQRATNIVAAKMTGAAVYQGAVSDNATIVNSDYKAGWYWVVQTAGTYVGQTCEPGDMIFCNTTKDGNVNYPDSGASNFDVVQNNIVEMTAAEVEAVCVL